MQRVGRVSRLEATASRRDRDSGIKVRAKREMQDGDMKTVAIDEI